jgi:uncharacterized protein YjbI with pentapeptide repeats
MPFSISTVPTSEPHPTATEAVGERNTQPETTADGNSDTWQQEKQVRLTAQRLLAEHLRDDRTPDQRSAGSPGPRFWPDIRLDLTGATLIDLDFHRIVAADARFNQATFTDGAQFYEATFTGFAAFRGATFHGPTVFSRAIFGVGAVFSHATFTGRNWFSQAKFGHDTDFNDATFDGDTVFYRTTFDGLAEFQQVTFGNDVMFSDTTFDSSAWFNGATFAKSTQFSGVTFADDTPFDGALFAGPTDFDGTIFANGADRLPFKETRVLSPSSRDVWPKGWRPMPDRKGGHLLGRVNATG